MSRRTERVNELLRDHISTVLARDINDPRIDGIVTITAVETSRDLAHARVWVSVAGGRENAQRTLQGLRSASGFLQRGLMGLGLRRTPELNFVIDDTMARVDRINQLLDSVTPGEWQSGSTNGGKRGEH